MLNSCMTSEQSGILRCECTNERCRNDVSEDRGRTFLLILLNPLNFLHIPRKMSSPTSMLFESFCDFNSRYLHGGNSATRYSAFNLGAEVIDPLFVCAAVT